MRPSVWLVAVSAVGCLACLWLVGCGGGGGGGKVTVTKTFTNAEGQGAVNDLHVELRSGTITVTSNVINPGGGSFINVAGSPGASIDFSGGNVPEGHTVTVTATYTGAEPELRWWWWTDGGVRVGEVHTTW